MMCAGKLSSKALQQNVSGGWENP